MCPTMLALNIRQDAAINTSLAMTARLFQPLAPWKHSCPEPTSQPSRPAPGGSAARLSWEGLLLMLTGLSVRGEPDPGERYRDRPLRAARLCGGAVTAMKSSAGERQRCQSSSTSRM
jgi:hypothetical protein